MHDGNSWYKPDVVASEPEAGAEVDVFVVQTVTDVKSVNRYKGVPSKQHEHAGYPVWRNTLVTDFIISLPRDS